MVNLTFILIWRAISTTYNQNQNITTPSILSNSFVVNDRRVDKEKCFYTDNDNNTLYFIIFYYDDEDYEWDIIGLLPEGSQARVQM